MSPLFDFEPQFRFELTSSARQFMFRFLSQPPRTEFSIDLFSREILPQPYPAPSMAREQEKGPSSYFAAGHGGGSSHFDLMSTKDLSR